MIWRPRKTERHTVPATDSLDDYSDKDDDNIVTDIESPISINEVELKEEEDEGTDIAESRPSHGPPSSSTPQFCESY